MGRELEELAYGKIYFLANWSGKMPGFFLGTFQDKSRIVSRNVVAIRNQVSGRIEAYKFNEFKVSKKGALELKRPFSIRLSENQTEYLEKILTKYGLPNFEENQNKKARVYLESVFELS
ncbi:MAG: hypothetical protein WDZ77_01755 [Candidatus Pacearchaeota archaeon]